MQERDDQPIIDFVAHIIVNKVMGDIVPDLEERQKLFVKTGKLREWHTYASEIMGGYFERKKEDLEDYRKRNNRKRNVHEDLL